MTEKTIEAELVQPQQVTSQPEPNPHFRTGGGQQSTQAVAIRETNGAVDRAMSLDELKENLAFIRRVMTDVMVEGQDFGKVPGCGDKPGLFQPGAQKLLMTFQLTDEVKEERVVDLPNYHREYSFVIRLVSRTGRTWEGVGTCSTLESKYRYRKAERRCPRCGKNTIIQGKAEYGGGWLCWKKKGGCDAKFAEDDQAITSQPGGTVENENPADNWNTVRKMAFKRALVHASINATNTSELWSQDLEDLPSGAGAEPAQKPPGRAGAPPPSQRPPQGQKPAPAPKPAQPAPHPFPTAESREKMIKGLDCAPNGNLRHAVTEYFQKIGGLLPSEEVEELPLRFVPSTVGEMKALMDRINSFVDGGEAQEAFPPHDAPPPAKKTKSAAPAKPPPTEEKPHPDETGEWFWKVIVPVPRRGMTRDTYLKSPDTIYSLYNDRHGSDDMAQEARQRLWGFLNNYEPKGWVKRDGTEMPPSEADKKFRRALDAFGDWFEREHPGEKL